MNTITPTTAVLDLDRATAAEISRQDCGCVRSDILEGPVATPPPPSKHDAAEAGTLTRVVGGCCSVPVIVHLPGSVAGVGSRTAFSAPIRSSVPQLCSPLRSKPRREGTALVMGASDNNVPDKVMRRPPLLLNY